MSTPSRRDTAVSATVTASPRTLTSWKVAALVVATLTPLSFMAGTTPLALWFGGPSFPVLIVVAAVIIGLFTVGYARMVRNISRPGAYYSYITRGLGRYLGVGAAYTGILTYLASSIAIFSITAFTIASALPAVGFPDADPAALFPWIFALQALLIALLVWRKIDLSVMISAVIVALEILTILVFFIVTVAQGRLDLAVFSPAAFDPALGDWTVAFIFAFLIYQAFEAGALYAPEAIRPEKSVPRGLFGALAVLTIASIAAAWALISHSSMDMLGADIAEQGPVVFVLNAVEAALGPVGLVLFSLLLILATAVATLGITNFVSRYITGLAREDLLPMRLAATNKFGAPAYSAFGLIIICAIFAYGTMLIGGDPYIQLVPIGFGLAAIGTTVLALLSSLSVIVFFGRTSGVERHWWSTGVAPVLATILIAWALVMELAGFSWITGVEEWWTNLLPLGIVIALIAGVLVTFWLRKNRPLIYRDLGAGDSAEEAIEIRRARLAETGAIKTPLS